MKHTEMLPKVTRTKVFKDISSSYLKSIETLLESVLLVLLVVRLVLSALLGQFIEKMLFFSLVKKFDSFLIRM